MTRVYLTLDAVGLGPADNDSGDGGAKSGGGDRQEFHRACAGTQTDELDASAMHERT